MLTGFGVRPEEKSSHSRYLARTAPVGNPARRHGLISASPGVSPQLARLSSFKSRGGMMGLSELRISTLVAAGIDVEFHCPACNYKVAVPSFDLARMSGIEATLSVIGAR